MIGNPTNSRTQYTLTWDAYNKTNSTWNSVTGGVPGLTQAETIEDPTSDTVGLEKFYAYTGKNTGAGSSVMTNLASGNAVWSYNAFSNPGRSLGTFARFAYNSLDTSDTVMGPGWSAQASAPIRLGAALDFHPNPNATEVTLTDGDGTSSVFTKQADGTFKAPAGVHYLLAMKGGVDCTPDKDDTSDAWSMTSPDGTRFFYDCEGYVTSIVDKNGNTETFTYSIRKSNMVNRKPWQHPHRGGLLPGAGRAGGGEAVQAAAPSLGPVVEGRDRQVRRERPGAPGTAAAARRCNRPACDALAR
jgi:hypothetical protein